MNFKKKLCNLSYESEDPKSKQEIQIEAIQGDITNQPDIVAIVNAANAQLRSGGGVARAIHQAAGPELERECRSLAPIKTGDAVISSGHQLSNPYVIHCLGPIYDGDKSTDDLLADCYRNALKIAESREISSIAFPAISAGIFGYPIELAAKIAGTSIQHMIPKLHFVKHIRFVLFSRQDLKIYEDVLHKYLGRNSSS